MRLEVTLQRRGTEPPVDIAIDAEANASVGSVAQAIIDRDPKRASAPPEGGDAVTLRVSSSGTERVVAPERELAESGILSGDVITVVGSGTGRFVEAGDERAAAATIVIQEGPNTGTRFHLRAGQNQIGRDASNDIVLADPMVSKHHARINVTDVIEVIDLGSANGVFVDSELVQRAVLRPGEHVVIGDTSLVVAHHQRPSAGGAGHQVAFNRSPYLDPIYPGAKHVAPEPPETPKGQQFPLIPLLVPMVFGLVVFAVTREAYTLLFMFMGPALMVGMYFQGTVSSKADFKKASAAFRDAIDKLVAELEEERAKEKASRRRQFPAPLEIVAATQSRGALLWARRPDRHGFLSIRCGVASLPTRSTVEVPPTNKTSPELWELLTSSVAKFANVDDVPLDTSLLDVGVLGISGPRADLLDTARAVLVQIAGLHSHSELILAAVTASDSAGDWEWFKWLPHVESGFSPIAVPHLAAGAGPVQALISAVEDLLDERAPAGGSGGSRGSGSGPSADGESDVVPCVPAVVLLVDNEAPIERSRLIDLAERGPARGVYLLWVAPSTLDLPAAAETFIALDPATRSAGVGLVDDGSFTRPVLLEPIDAAGALMFARSLAPVIDSGARSDSSADLPSSVSFLGHAGLDLAESPDAVVDRWRLSDSLPTTEARRAPKKRDNPLHALIGAGASDPVLLDLRSQGPHALVGGTTGAGKSEFLQTWVLGLASTHSPARVTFLFVDYKGGAAFSECIHLPHSVGIVTDLTPHLVRRALRSLNAELRYREHVLQRHKAKDVLEMERRGEPETPPSLVLVVDEFAALVQEVPEFVDGVVNVAQRGRSLGLHLVLATQRPAGVIKDNLRANTNLRVALRMADEDDSTDVIGIPLAASFDSSIPGRAVAKTGPGRLTPFQTGYVGGWTTETPAAPEPSVGQFEFGGVRAWERTEVEEEAVPVEVDPGPNDLLRLVSTMRDASARLGLPAPRKPWLPSLAPTYDLLRAPQTRRDDELTFAIADEPDEQRQSPVAFLPDIDGNMCVVGTGGAGKSGFLRTVAVVAGSSTRSGPCHVYCLDFGGRGLQMLEPLPHVGAVIAADDDERTARLLRMLHELIDSRATKYASMRAGSITEYRQLANQPDEPRVLLLLDGLGAFRNAYETGQQSHLYDLLQSIASEGRPVGVHLLVSADRVSAIPTALASVIQRRLVLRLANEDDYLMAGVASDIIAESSPPGRGVFGGSEVQVTVLGGSANTATQADAMVELGEQLRRAMPDRAPAPEIRRLPDEVDLDELPAEVAGLPTLGIEDEQLGPVGVQLDVPMLIVGPPRSGKTTAMATMARSLRRRDEAIELWFLGDNRAPLRGLHGWDEVMTSEEEINEQKKALDERIAGGTLEPQRIALFLDDVGKLSGETYDAEIVELIQALLGEGQIVIGDGETSAVSSSWPLLKLMKLNRAGLALVPDQYDGDSVFNTPFPRTNRKDYPPGRGLLVRDGRVLRVQVAR